LAPFVSQHVVFFIASITSDDLATLNELIEANKVTPIIDRRYPLCETPAAIRYLKEGHARGKVVITVP
jgi:NADPH:quinone reductase-like Zn-dependent oxidoreductase